MRGIKKLQLQAGHLFCVKIKVPRAIRRYGMIERGENPFVALGGGAGGNFSPKAERS
jgi:hypothetical protein